MFEKIVDRGTLMTVTVLIVCVLGIVAALRIPVQMIPDLDVRVISVRTIWPGATPQDVEKEILIEQEDYLRNLPNLSRIIATAHSGRAEIELALAPLPAAAEAVVLTQWVLRNLAHERGMRCSFDPIVRAGHAGSGLHFHFAPVRGDRNLGGMSPDGTLTDEARWLLGGLSKRAPAKTTVTVIQTTNML